LSSDAVDKLLDKSKAQPGALFGENIIASRKDEN
jgi:hypothetical protein